MSENETWIESVDPRTGRTFYANPITRETRWEKPEPSLPPNWERMQDEATGRVFYVDHVRKVTTWNHPTATAATSTPKNDYSAATHSSSNASPAMMMSSQSTNSSNNFYTSSSNHANTFASESSSGVSLNFLKSMDFKVQKVPDELRPNCPSCDMEFSTTAFSLNRTKRDLRRHHCRLCGDVVCNDCSMHKVVLPLEGDEFNKAVRVCNACHVDVERGDYFSMRRYLTPLTLYTPPQVYSQEQKTQIKAALYGLAQDLNACLLDSTSFSEKVTLSPSQLVPAITNYLSGEMESETQDYAITTFSILLALANVVERTSEYTKACDIGTVYPNMLSLLEQSNRTIPIQEQCVRATFYIVTSVQNLSQQHMENTLRLMLDCCMLGNASTSLQRWAVATIQHTIPFLPDNFDLQSCGCIMILGSLLSSDDADIRTHATAALTATIYANPTPQKQSSIVSSIHDSGALQTSLTPMLVCSDPSVVIMACTFCKCLVTISPQNFPMPNGFISTLLSIIQNSSSLHCKSIAFQLLALLKTSIQSTEEVHLLQVLLVQHIQEQYANRETHGWHLLESCAKLLHPIQNSYLQLGMKWLETCPPKLASAFDPSITVQSTFLSVLVNWFQDCVDLQEWTREALEGGLWKFLVPLLNVKVPYQDPIQARQIIVYQSNACHLLALMLTTQNNDSLLTSTSNSICVLFSSTALHIQSYTGGAELPLNSLLEASLIAVGSLVGANIYNQTRKEEVLPSDLFVTEKESVSPEKQKLAEMACQVLSSQNNTFLSAILVGAYGPECVFPAIRLTFAIVPYTPLPPTMYEAFSDILSASIKDYVNQRIPLSMVLSIIRKSTGSIGRFAIPAMATLFASKPSTNPESVEMQTWRCLQVECMYTLEALSQHPSLWSMIMTTSLPQMNAYLLEGTNDNAIHVTLQAIQRMIPLPAHAMTAAKNGIGTPLCKLICSSEKTITMALQVLHNLSTHAAARLSGTNELDLYHCGSVTAACTALTISAKTEDSSLISKLALEILLYHIQDLQQLENNRQELINIFFQAISRQRSFLQCLCATLLSQSFEEKQNTLVTPSLYGTPLSFYDGAVAGYESTYPAAVALVSFIASLSSSSNNNNNNIFWHVFCLIDFKDSLLDERQKYATVIAACSTLFAMPDIDIPKQFLLKEIQSNVTQIIEHNNNKTEESSIFPFLEQYKIPQTCLQLCNDPALRPYAFPILESILIEHPDDILPLMIADKESLSTCLDLLDCNTTTTISIDDEEEEDPRHVSTVIAHVIGTCAERGDLAPAVDKFNLRSTAIASLSAACLLDPIAEEEDDDDHPVGSTVTKSCLHALVGIFSNYDEDMKFSVMEARAIATNLGGRLSNVVLQRFVKHAETTTSKRDITNAPEIALLCELASVKEALPDLCANGGLEALSLVANEGAISAINALFEACESEPQLVLDVEGHISIMHVLTDEGKVNESNELACMQLLACIASQKKGRCAIAEADDSYDCIVHASDILIQTTQRIKNQSGSKDDSNCDHGILEKESKEEETKERITAFWEKKQVEKIETTVNALELASLSFLSSLLRDSTSRQHILFENDALIQSLFYLVSHETGHVNLQYATLSFLWNASSFVRTDEACTFSLKALSSTMLSVLSIPVVLTSNAGMEMTCHLGHIKESINLSQNLVLARAISLQERYYFQLEEECKVQTLDVISMQLVNIIRNTIATNKKTYRRVLLKTSSGRLVYECTSFLYRFTASSKQMSLSPPALAAMMSLILNYEDIFLGETPSTDEEMNESNYWNASTTKCVELFSLLYIDIDTILTDDVMKSFLPKKQALKSIDITTAFSQSLISFLNNSSSDATRSMVSKRILERIEL